LILLTSPRKRIGVILLAFGALLLFNLYRHFIAESFSPDNIYYLSFWSQFLTSPFLLEFFAGSLVSWWVIRRPEGPSWSWLLIGSALFLAGGWINESMYSGLIEQGFHVVPRVMVYGLPACMLLTGLVRLETMANHAAPEHAAGTGSTGMRTPVRFSALTGGASYAIYLSHVLILTVVWNTPFNQLVASWPGHMIIVVYVLLVSAIAGYSVLHYVYLEKPLHRLFKRWLGLDPGATWSARKT